MPRKSELIWSLVRVPVRNPLPSGEYGTKPTPSSAHAGTTLRSTSRDHRLHSLCTAAIGWTAWARCSSGAVTSLSPRWRTFPASISSLSAPMVSSMVVSGSGRCM